MQLVFDIGESTLFLSQQGKELKEESGSSLIIPLLVLPILQFPRVYSSSGSYILTAFTVLLCNFQIAFFSLSQKERYGPTSFEMKIMVVLLIILTWKPMDYIWEYNYWGFLIARVLI